MMYGSMAWGDQGCTQSWIEEPAPFNTLRFHPARLVAEMIYAYRKEPVFLTIRWKIRILQHRLQTRRAR
jgi:hypothetical protein